MALTQISTEGIKNGTITGSDLATNIDLIDNQALRFGTGNDLQIFHDGSNSKIVDTGTGSLLLLSNSFKVQNAAGTENQIIGNENGAIELYHNNVKKFETTSNGATLFGYLNVGSGTSNWGFLANDSTRIGLGTSQDLILQHDGTDSIISNSTGDLQITDTSDDITITAADDIRLRPQGGENGINVLGNGVVELYCDNSKKFQTDSDGFQAFGGQFVFYGNEGGASQLLIYADEGDDLNDRWRVMAGGSNDFIIGNLSDGTWDTNIKAIGDGAVELYYDHSKKFETESFGATLTGNLDVNSGSIKILTDSQKLELGAGGDLQIYHDGSNSYIDDAGTGALNIRTNNSNINFKGGGSFAHDLAIFKSTEGVELFYNNSKKLETTSSGATVTGTLTATAFAGDGSALTGVGGIPTGVIVLWSGAANAIPSGFALCDGNNSTPDLRDRFVVGAGNSYSVGATGGATTDTVSISVSGTTSTQGSTSNGSGATSSRLFRRNDGGVHTHSFSGSGSATVDTLPPYYALCYIMKT